MDPRLIARIQNQGIPLTGIVAFSHRTGEKQDIDSRYPVTLHPSLSVDAERLTSSDQESREEVKPNPGKTYKYRPDDVVNIVDGFAKQKLEPSTASGRILESPKAKQPSSRSISHVKKTLLILEEMMAEKSDKNRLPSVMQIIRIAREQWHFHPSISEVYEASAEYKSRHPGVINGEKHKKETREEPSTVVSSQKVGSLDEQNKHLTCTVEYGSFRITVEGSQQSDLKQVLTTICKTLRDCDD